MSQIITSVYMGSPEIQVSTENYEVIPATNPKWTQKLSFRKFSFDNTQACTVIVNNQATLYLKEGQGFEIDFKDAPIYSFIIVESNISYNWIGAY